MSGSGDIKPALERVLAGTASEDDRGAVSSALVNGVLVTGKRAVAIGGSADVIITTGDGNIVLSFRGTDVSAVQAILNSVTQHGSTNFLHLRVTSQAARKS